MITLILKFFESIYNNKKSLLIFIFFTAVLFSLIFLFFFKNIGPAEHQIPGSDYLNLYEPMARNIVEGKGVAVEGRVPLTIGLGYPIILSGIFSLAQRLGIGELDLVVVFNVILTALTSVFLFLLASELFNKKIALIASFLWLSYPFNLWFLKNPNTESPFILLLLAGLWLYVLAFKKGRLKLVFLSGFILGMASFVRIVGLFFPLFLVLLLPFFLKDVSQKRKLLLAVILLMGSFIAFLPWGIITFSETGGFIPFSTWGPEAIVASATWIASPGAREPAEIIPNDVIALTERVKAAELTSFPEVAQFFSQELISRPLPLLKLTGLKLARSWYGTSTRWHEEWIVLAIQLLYLMTAFLGLFCLIKAVKNKFGEIIFLLAVIFFFWGMNFIAVSIMRYMIPVMGLVMIFSAVLINFLIEKLTPKKPDLL